MAFVVLEFWGLELRDWEVAFGGYCSMQGWGVEDGTACEVSAGSPNFRERKYRAPLCTATTIHVCVYVYIYI